MRLDRTGFRVCSVALLITIILFSLSAGSPAAGGESESPVVKAGVDRTTVSIGDRVRYEISVHRGPDMEVQFPDFGDNLGDFAIRDFGSSEGGFFSSKKESRWYILDIYESGEHVIPGTLVKYRKKGEEPWHEIVTDPVTVSVVSALEGDTEKADIRDIKGPVGTFPAAYLIAALVIIAVVVTAVTVYFIMKKRKRSAEGDLLPPRPAHERAYEALQALAKKDYLRSGQVRQYYVEVSGIVRQYIENRFQLRAPEMTTEEFLATMQKASVLNDEQKRLMALFLSHCDMVKFARYIPDENEITSSYESAKRFIDETKEVSLPKADGKGRG